MAILTTALPSGGSASAASRPRRRNNRTAKEHKDKPKKGRLSHDDWLADRMPYMVDNLCLKMYESPLPTIYSRREQFCEEFADHVIDCSKVKVAKDRCRDLDVVLNHAVAMGRVVIRDAHHGRRVRIELSTSEKEVQSKLAEERQAEQDRKWADRRRRKEHWAVV